MSLTLARAVELAQYHTTVLDRDHTRLGVLAQVYVDDQTNDPLWAAVVFDPPSTVETVVPIHDAHIESNNLVVNYPWTLVMAGPRISAGDDLPWVEEERLRSHYGQQPPSVDAAEIVPVMDL